ncbi:N-acetylmuramoyl-L-alanine amidase [Serratia plymuthica]|uniref:N-acetylmuramoyl-L-alanine amidase n=1 Tax=Serratia plymuthica TaxID=82996 RepID=A0A7T2SNA6_SERPL|nr:N-acetylmuramoyl-L-alanine amidase [Serratia plymuthica]QPS18669.1 N-acetylmuramoyl-L-alanine amidase [Serratia plymuthica]QPS64942.1 N-acetylmuramoyl-L-alanine amidase [Serratia plymuthica]RKS62601.1 N-acetylmuramoyl-L-alanine amidase [Serratia plymuthica]UNK28394.1 N-acetylmuramoyl-L-alanine amidase [Serratia plymuthica]CAI2500999.1 N-acetylmuramoyl-L-alanine amidase [Serratia plymuthica]
MSINYPLNKGSQDPYITIAQQQLIRLGYGLPRFGADGVLGDETLSAYGAFLISQGLRAPTDDRPKSITPSGVAALDMAFAALTNDDVGTNIIDERANHPHSGRSVSMPYRPWSKITAVVLHQTATKIGEKVASWHSVPIHIGITRAGKIIQLYYLTEVCNHANGLNRRSVGIEIDGWYAGIEGKPETLWQPKNQPTPRLPMNLPIEQAVAAKAAVQWIVNTVKANGGKVTHIHPHRQSSKDRRSDPGSLIWQHVGLWAQNTLGLSDGGASFIEGDGLTIPEAWDARYTGNHY